MLDKMDNTYLVISRGSVPDPIKYIYISFRPYLCMSAGLSICSVEISRTIKSRKFGRSMPIIDI